MATPYVGEIRIFAGNFAPEGWAFCAGQLLAISQYPQLYQLIGTTYGGDGSQTFALPDLRSRVPVHVGTGFVLGQPAGTETVTLTTQQIPGHSHVPNCNSANGNNGNPTMNVWAGTSTTAAIPYSAGPPAIAFAGNAIGLTGGSQPHDNMLPYQAINFILALYGIYPTP